MQSLFFWKNWPADYRWIGYGIAVLFFSSLIFLWFSYFQGVDGIIHWDKVQEQKVIETPVHAFQLGPFRLEVPAESYVLFEYFNGSFIEPNTLASYLFLGVLSVCIVVLLSVLTTLERFWFYAAMALFILFVVSLRLEVLGIFGQHNRFVVGGVLALFVIPAFYFNQFGRSISFVVRLITFAVLATLVGVAVGFFSDTAFPAYSLSMTGYAAGLVLSVLFIIMIAHEIFAGFVYMLGRGSTKSLTHISIISAIYFFNLLVTALHEMDVIQWNFIYINLYLLLTISAVIGIWGFREREPIYGNIISFAPFGAYFFLAMGTICFITTGQLLANGNDPALKLIRDAVIFSHTGFGLIFLTYLFSNFILMLARNLDISKVLYKPNRMPYFTYRFAGMIAMLAFVFVSDWKEYVYNGMSGFYNYAGDKYTLEGDEVYAESFYDQGRSNGFANHRSNYALGTIKASRFNLEGARENFDDASYKHPSEYSLVNFGNTYLWESNTFGAIEAFQEGRKVMPNSGALANNLGFAYARVHNLDSAIFYLDKARQYKVSKQSAEANFFAMAAVELLPFDTDSILNTFGATSPATLANALVISSIYNQPASFTTSPLAAQKLDLYQATLLNNYLIKNAKKVDTLFTAEASRIASDPVNEDYSIALKSSLAFAYYHQGYVAKALEVLAELVYISQSHQGKYNYIMGLWALEQGNPDLASSYFTYAQTYDYKQAKFYNAIALTEGRRLDEARQAWDVVLAGEDEGEREIATRLKQILSVSAPEVMGMSDGEKYQFCRYRIGLQDSTVFNRLINSFESADYKAQALLDISRRYYEVDEIIPAIKFFSRIAGLRLTDKRLYQDVQHFELIMLASRKELPTLTSQMNKGVTFDKPHHLEKLWYDALLAESTGDTLTAEKNYTILGKYNPYFEEGVLAAADFFREKEPNSLKSYSILAEAIQVNKSSIRLLRAYIAEALRKELTDYAMSVSDTFDELLRRTQKSGL
ncbi:MAG TPA: hypothetical protein VGK59_04120 [Ohtaekwangia sp.]